MNRSKFPDEEEVLVSRLISPPNICVFGNVALSNILHGIPLTSTPDYKHLPYFVSKGKHSPRFNEKYTLCTVMSVNHRIQFVEG